jgi:gluconolactonase
VSRRVLLGGAGAALGGALAFPRWAYAQAAPADLLHRRAPSRSHRATSVRRGAPTTYFTDPDVLSIDPMFDWPASSPTPDPATMDRGAVVRRGRHGIQSGAFLVWSDIPNNRQLRWSEDDGHVSVFRAPSNNSNGNTFDYQGRQLSCEHLTRRVVRYELDGSVTVLASTFKASGLNSPNDVVPHPDGSYWFTDPPYGAQLYEGTVDAARRPGEQVGADESEARPAAGDRRLQAGDCRPRVYRLDKSGTLTQVAGEDLVPDPNGLCFSPDFKKLYVVSTGKDRATRLPAARATCRCSTSDRTTSSAMASCSAASWSTA